MGIVHVPSKYTVPDTLQRLEAALAEIAQRARARG